MSHFEFLNFFSLLFHNHLLLVGILRQIHLPEILVLVSHSLTFFPFLNPLCIVESLVALQVLLQLARLFHSKAVT